MEFQNRNFKYEYNYKYKLPIMAKRKNFYFRMHGKLRKFTFVDQN